MEYIVEDKNDKILVFTLRRFLGKNKDNKSCKFKKWLSKKLNKSISTKQFDGKSYVLGYKIKKLTNNELYDAELKLSKMDKNSKEYLNFDKLLDYLYLVT